MDVSAQQAAALATQTMLVAGAMGAFGSRRVGGGSRFGPFTVRFVWPARDGWVSITYLFEGVFACYTRRLMGVRGGWVRRGDAPQGLVGTRRRC